MERYFDRNKGGDEIGIAGFFCHKSCARTPWVPIDKPMNIPTPRNCCGECHVYFDPYTAHSESDFPPF